MKHAELPWPGLLKAEIAQALTECDVILNLLCPLTKIAWPLSCQDVNARTCVLNYWFIGSVKHWGTVMTPFHLDGECGVPLNEILKSRHHDIEISSIGVTVITWQRCIDDV